MRGRGRWGWGGGDAETPEGFCFLVFFGAVSSRFLPALSRSASQACRAGLEEQSGRRPTRAAVFSLARGAASLFPAKREVEKGSEQTLAGVGREPDFLRKSC